MRRITVVGAVLVLVLIPAASADAAVASAAGMSVFRDTPAREDRLAIGNDGSTTVRAWTIAHGVFNSGPGFIVVKMGADPARRLTGRNTKARLGGLDLNNSRGELLAYDLSVAGRNYDIRLFDLAAHHRIVLPAGIDTGKDEFNSSVSGSWLLFTRNGNREATNHVVLAKLDGSDTRTLADAHARGFVDAQQVNGDWAVYTVCHADPSFTFKCRVHRYRISTHTDVTLPNGPNHDAEGASVTTDGTVYYVELGRGSGARLIRWTGGASTILRQFGKDILPTDPWPYERPGGGGVTLFFVRRVGVDRSGIYYISV